jgi:hypothetical protein
MTNKFTSLSKLVLNRMLISTILQILYLYFQLNQVVQAFVSY